MRIDYGPGYRVYYKDTGQENIIILCGGDKSTQKDDIDFLLSVLSALARSKGMAQIAADLGVSREGLYKSLAPGSNPAFATVVKTLDTLGFRLNIELKHAS